MGTTFRLVVSACLILFIGACSQSPEELLVGDWKGLDGTGQTASLVFNQDGTVAMIQGSTVLDGKSIGGEVRWTLDATKDPMHLDVVVSPSSGQKSYMRMILRFITNDKVQARMSEGGITRPTGFSAAEDAYQVLLERQ